MVAATPALGESEHRVPLAVTRKDIASVHDRWLCLPPNQNGYGFFLGMSFFAGCSSLTIVCDADDDIVETTS